MAFVGSRFACPQKAGLRRASVQHGGPPQKESQDARPQEERPWSYWKAPQASWWLRKRWWPAPPPNQLRQVPSWLLRKGWYAKLSPDQARQDHPHHQRGAIVVACV
eukprot:Skav207610  [mRNA]  locus=scaffold1878:50033:51002:+ [translate_table: standard]